MENKFTQPKVRYYYDWLRNDDHWGTQLPSYDERSNVLLDELFALTEKIKPIYENGACSLWFRAEKGTIEDYGDVDEMIENGEVESREELQEIWEGRFTEDVEWYEFTAVSEPEMNFRAISLHHNTIIVQDERRPLSGFPYKISEFVQWLLDSVKECIGMLEDGTYNDFIRKNLPPKHRVGTITRKAFWDVCPEARESFFKDISHDDVEEFCELAYSQNDEIKKNHNGLNSMTANDFYHFCALGYAQNKYNGCNKSPREQYDLHADGRDDGLSEIDPDSPDAFHEWLHNRASCGGHPWEVCRGESSTHISLYVGQGEQGYYLTLAGDAWNRTIETVKFYLALRRENIPVFLHEAKLLADRLTEKEKIGIVPDGVMPAYCESWFPNEHIIDFINLPEEDTEKYIPFCKWQDIKATTLK